MINNKPDLITFVHVMVVENEETVGLKDDLEVMVSLMHSKMFAKKLFLSYQR